VSILFSTNGKEERGSASVEVKGGVRSGGIEAPEVPTGLEKEGLENGRHHVVGCQSGEGLRNTKKCE